jgi:xanthine dehydrogenase accessory factor
VKSAEVVEAILRALEGGDAVVEVVVLEGPQGTASVGARMLVWADRHSGSLGSQAVDAAAAEAAREVLSTGRAGSKALEAEGFTWTIFLEPHRAPDELVIVGAGHIARPLARVGAMLGMRVIVLDDRPEFATTERFPDAARVLRTDFSDPFREVPITERSFVVLVTRGHKYDFDSLRDILERGVTPAYVGMVGSQRRVRAAMDQLAKEGFPVDDLRKVHSPIGLDIRAETPEEIAISIAAEMILVRRGGTGEPMRDRARVVERWIRG